jgi:hypothetical protein
MKPNDTSLQWLVAALIALVLAGTVYLGWRALGQCQELFGAARPAPRVKGDRR